mgnify:CR=1 FL=1
MLFIRKGISNVDIINIPGGIMRIIVLLALLLVGSSIYQVRAQDEKVRTYMQLLAAGRIDEVKMALPDLLVDYPGNPGVMMLHAAVIEDGEKAMEIYQRIVRQQSDNEWADDAYWRVIQYYAIKGDIETAQRELNNFRKNYPNSEFLSPASDVVSTAQRIYNHRDIKINTDIAQDIKPKQSKEPQAIPKEKTEVKPKTETKTPPKKESPKAEESYGLQVGIYSTREAAEREKDRFYKMRMNTEVMEKTVDTQTMYAVVIGEYTSIESAEHAKRIVQLQCRCSPIIFKR